MISNEMDQLAKAVKEFTQHPRVSTQGALALEFIS